jgi:hypothetical protein
VLHWWLESAGPMRMKPHLAWELGRSPLPSFRSGGGVRGCRGSRGMHGGAPRRHPHKKLPQMLIHPASKNGPRLKR